MNEAETCRTLVRPKLEAVGWLANGERHYREQISITDGRVVLSNGKPKRLKKKVPDFLLHFTRDYPLAVVEAKSMDRPATDGIQQAKDYAAILKLPFAYATNGTEIIEYDGFTEQETTLSTFPSPDQLYARLQSGSARTSAVADALLVPDYFDEKKRPRYYQRIAIEMAIGAVVGGQKRCLLTLATGTGKTTVAFQIAWKLWSAKWTAAGDRTRRPRILFLADRNKLVDDPMAKDFAPFGDARHKIEDGKVVKGREMYFAIYQAIAATDTRPALYTQYPADYFDLIIIDECHRGSAKDESSWRDILLYFHPAYQLGMTATPLREDNRDTYLYFGNPLYIYSLKDGIADGFLAPYRLHRIITTFDAAGWRPVKGQRDKGNQPIPDRQYATRDFERVISLESRNKIVAKHLTDFLARTDPMAKTIVFCVDQDHAAQLRQELHNLNPVLARQAKAEGTEYVARVTADEGELGGGYLDQFQDPENDFPVILTTSLLLTTGVDAPTCRNVVLVRQVGQMTEFKQIIGRGTRLKEDYGKLFFNIIDYVGVANEKFTDPDFDGVAEEATEEELNEYGEVIRKAVEERAREPEEEKEVEGEDRGGGIINPRPPRRPKLRVHGGEGSVAVEATYDLDPDGKKLRAGQITQYFGNEVRVLTTDTDGLRRQWARSETRAALLAELEGRGIDFPALAADAGEPDSDPFDLLAHIAYNQPIRTRKSRKDTMVATHADFLARFTPGARGVLETLLDKYAAHGPSEFELPHALEVPPLAEIGSVSDIAARFGGTRQLLDAVDELQQHLYAN